MKCSGNLWWRELHEQRESKLTLHALLVHLMEWRQVALASIQCMSEELIGVDTSQVHACSLEDETLDVTRMLEPPCLITEKFS